MATFTSLGSAVVIRVKVIVIGALLSCGFIATFSRGRFELVSGEKAVETLVERRFFVSRLGQDHAERVFQEAPVSIADKVHALHGVKSLRRGDLEFCSAQCLDKIDEGRVYHVTGCLLVPCW